MHFWQTALEILMQVIREPSLKNINLKQRPYLANTKDTRQFTFLIFYYMVHMGQYCCVLSNGLSGEILQRCAGWNQGGLRLQLSDVEPQ